MLAAFLREWGAEPLRVDISPDDPVLLASALKAAVDSADAVLFLAGSSKGTKDYSMDVLADAGKILVHELAHGPGRHSSLTIVGGKPVFGVAGPPVGALIVARLYLRPFVDCLLGQPLHEYEEAVVTLDVDLAAYDVDFVEMLYVYRREGAFRARPAMPMAKGFSQAGRIANAYYYHPAGASWQAGEELAAELMSPRELITEEEK